LNTNASWHFADA